MLRSCTVISRVCTCSCRLRWTACYLVNLCLACQEYQDIARGLMQVQVQGCIYSCSRIVLLMILL